MNIATNILKEIISESIEEEFYYLNEAKKKKKNKKSSSKEKKTSGMSSQAISILNDPMVNNAEVGRQLKKLGILHGSEDSIRSRVSKQRRKLRPLVAAEAPGIVNMSSID